MKAEVMNAAISKESPVSPGFQLNEDDVQKIEGVVTGGAQSLMQIVPQVESAVRSFKLFTNQMFSGLQKFYRATPRSQASTGDIESADAGVLPETENLSQAFSVQPGDNGIHRRGMADVFTNVGQQIGYLLEQQPEALAQQLGMTSNTVNGMQRGPGQFGASEAVVMTPTAGLLVSHSAAPAEVSSLVEPIAPAKQSIAATPVVKGTQGLDSLAQKLLVNLQPGVNSLNQLVNQWPVGDSSQVMEQVGAISKSLQIEPTAILNLSNPGVVSGLMGELGGQDTRHYPYAQGASLTLTQPAAASHNLNQTTTINVYGAADPQVTANEIEARQTNIHSRLSQQLSGGPR